MENSLDVHELPLDVEMIFIMHIMNLDCLWALACFHHNSAVHLKTVHKNGQLITTETIKIYFKYFLYAFFSLNFLLFLSCFPIQIALILNQDT